MHPALSALCRNVKLKSRQIEWQSRLGSIRYIYKMGQVRLKVEDSDRARDTTWFGGVGHSCCPMVLCSEGIYLLFEEGKEVGHSLNERLSMPRVMATPL